MEVETDLTGEAFLPWPTDRDIIMYCETAGLRGLLRIGALSPPPVLLVMRPISSLTVRVTNSLRLPLPDVYLDVVHILPDGTLLRTEDLCVHAITSANGMAVIEQIEAWSCDLPANTQLGIRAHVLGGSDVVAKLDRDHPPSDPISISIADSGRLRIRILSQSGDLEPCDTVAYVSTGSDSSYDSGVAVELKGGIGAVSGLHVGTRFRVQIPELDPPHDSCEVNGPRWDGDEVSLDVTARQVNRTLIGVAVDALDRPLSGARLIAWDSSRVYESRMPNTLIADDGRFELSIMSLSEGSVRRSTQLRIMTESARIAFGADVTIPESDVAFNDLGTVHFSPLGDSIFGRVMDRNHSLLPRAEVLLRSPTGSQITTTDSRGEFSFFEAGAVVGSTLTVSANGYSPSEEVSIVEGLREYDIVLDDRSARLVGRILSDESLSSSLVRCGLVLHGERVSFDSMRGSTSIVQDGRFVVGDIGPGDYDVVVATIVQGQLNVVALVPSVVLDSNRVCADPRVNPIDVRSRLRVLHIKSDGARAEFIRVSEQLTGNTIFENNWCDSEIELAVGIDEVLVELWGPDCRYAAQTNARGEVHVHLVPALDIPVHVQFSDAGTREMAAASSIYVVARPCAVSDPHYEVSGVVDKDGEAELHLPDLGEWTVGVYVNVKDGVRSRRCELDVAVARLVVASTNPASVEIGMAESALRRALDDAASGK
jgi:hypothetical protein